MQALPAQPESLCIVEMGGVEKQDELGEKGTIGFLYLNIGLQVLLLYIYFLYIYINLTVLICIFWFLSSERCLAQDCPGPCHG